MIHSPATERGLFLDVLMNTIRLRNLQPGARFILLRTGDRYEFLGHKRDTPGGTQYVVRLLGFASTGTLHPACHVQRIDGEAQ